MYFQTVVITSEQQMNTDVINRFCNTFVTYTYQDDTYHVTEISACSESLLYISVLGCTRRNYITSSIRFCFRYWAQSPRSHFRSARLSTIFILLWQKPLNNSNPLKVTFYARNPCISAWPFVFPMSGQCKNVG